MSYSLHVPLIGGRLKLKSESRLRRREWDGEVPVWRFGSLCVIWEPARLITHDRRVTTASLDVYMNIKDARLRIATARGAGLPSQMNPRGWQITLPAESPPVIEDAEEDVRERGFCRYKFVDQPQRPGLGPP